MWYLWIRIDRVLFLTCKHLFTELFTKKSLMIPKGLVRSHKSKDRQYSDRKKKDKGQTMVDKTQYKKLRKRKILHYEPLGMNSGDKSLQTTWTTHLANLYRQSTACNLNFSSEHIPATHSTTRITPLTNIYPQPTKQPELLLWPTSTHNPLKNLNCSSDQHLPTTH